MVKQQKFKRAWFKPLTNKQLKGIASGKMRGVKSKPGEITTAKAELKYRKKKGIKITSV